MEYEHLGGYLALAMRWAPVVDHIPQEFSWEKEVCFRKQYSASHDFKSITTNGQYLMWDALNGLKQGINW